MLDCSDGCHLQSEDPWPPSCTWLMFAQLLVWSMPALSGMAPYVKRRPSSREDPDCRRPLHPPSSVVHIQKPTTYKALDWPPLCWRCEIASLCLLHRFVTRATDKLPATHALPFSQPAISEEAKTTAILPAARTTRHTTSFFFSASLWRGTLSPHTSRA